MENPFKAIEPDAVCPPHLKVEIISEIDLIRDVLQVLELYTSDLIATVLGHVVGLTDGTQTGSNPTL